jgi:hypothetical protein
MRRTPIALAMVLLGGSLATRALPAGARVVEARSATAPSAAQPRVISAATPATLAAAMDIPAGSVDAATFGTSDATAFGIRANPLGAFFPSKGGSFAIMATGLASTAETANDSPSTTTVLGGLNNSQGFDMAQLRLTLRPPANAKCLSFEFAFYSEEFPEFVGSQFNDAFTAELGGTDLTIVGDQIVAPLNFAFDSQANLITINTVFGVTPNTGTTYDGVTPKIVAIAPLEASHFPAVDLYLTIQDLGDSFFDSAVFVDNFNWLFDINCAGGGFIDSDGDALLDVWETDGIDVDQDGTIDLDLPAMGADPQRKDLFVEVDYMTNESFCAFGFCVTGHSHKPKPAALQRIIDAFAGAPVSNPDGSTGITIHIDAGPDTVMNPHTGALWGARSESEALDHVDQLGSCPVQNNACTGMYDWSAFDQIKQAHFSLLRKDVFHYNVFAHQLGASSHSGISRGISASDFLVTLGTTVGSVGTVSEQTGTFFHEVGHNLSLRHGGDDDQNFEPNYLSIMNYSFQMRGLRIDGVDANFDYSTAALPALNENNLDETTGIFNFTPVQTFGTRYYCGGAETILNDANAPIDWNCDGDATDTGVVQNINNDGGLGTLGGYNDWANIRFDGGAIGKLGQVVELPMETESSEITMEQDATIETPFGVCISGPGDVFLLPGSYVYDFELINTGESADTYDLSASATMPWADLSGLPPSLHLTGGASAMISIPVEIPVGTVQGTQDELVLEVTSSANPLLTDSATVRATVGELDTDLDGRPDSEESGPDGDQPDFDGNADLVPDRLQANVTSLKTFDGQSYVTIEAASGVLFMDVMAIDNPSPGNAPSSVLFPYGFFSFVIKGIAPGGSVALTMHLPGAASGYHKFGPTPGDPTDHWYSFFFDGTSGATFAANQVVLTFADGAKGDDDLDAGNGMITDAGGPTLPAPFNGSVLYYRDGRPVSGVDVDLGGQSAVTDADGAYGFAQPMETTQTLEPAKVGDFRDAIGSLDVAFVQQRVIGSRTFDAMQDLACDVTGNGAISSLDAARIQQLRLGIITRFPIAGACDSDWVFLPDAEVVANQSFTAPSTSLQSCQGGAISYEPLVPPAADQDFVAILFGDCTGNWNAD